MRVIFIRHGMVPVFGSYDLERIIKDADKGHVQMKDMPLEIVDLR